MANWPGTVVDESELAGAQAPAGITGTRAPAQDFRSAAPPAPPAPSSTATTTPVFPGEEVTQDVDRSTSLTQFATPTLGNAQLSEDGTSNFARPEDREFASLVQNALRDGKGRAEIDALSDRYGFPRYGPVLDRAVADAANGLLWTVGVPTWGHREASMLAPIANSSVGAGIGAAADVGAVGLTDEIAGLAGGDSFMDVVRGEGEAQQRAQLLKDAAGEEFPVATTVGSLAGGITGALGAGKIAGAGRQIAADAGFGAAYGAGSSNDNRLAGAALGGTAAATGSYFGGKLLDKIANRAPSVAAKAVETARRHGIDLPMGAMGRGKAIIDNTLSNMPGSAQVMQSGRDILADEVGNAVENVADSFGPTTSFPAMGDALQAGANKWIDKFQKVAGKAYDAIPISGKAKASLTNTASTLEDMTGKFSSNPKLADAMRNTRLSRYMDALGNKGDELSWEDLKAFRSRIGEEIGDQRFSDGTMKSELRGLYGALSEDMKNTAAAQGPAALRAFEKANTLYKQGQDRIDGALAKILGDDGKLAPEKAAARLQAISRAGKSSSDIATLAAIRKSMPAEEWGQVTNALVRLLGKPVNSEGRDFSAQAFTKTFDDMSPAAKNLIFGSGELRKNLDEFNGVIENLAKVNALRNTSNTAGQLLTGLGFSSMGGITGLATQAATSYSLAKLWTNPRFVKWATGYARMARATAQAGGQPNVGKQLGLLKKVAAAEPAIAQDALGLQQYLAQQFASSPSRLAAEDGQEPSQ